MAARRPEYLTSYRLISETLSTGRGRRVLIVSGESPRLDELIRTARDRGVEVRRVSRKELHSLAPGAHDCALELAGAPPDGEPTLDDVLTRSDPAHSLFLVLDHITDPHNFGAILRSADQFGVDAVIVPGRRSAPLSAVAIQSSAGTAANVTIVTVANLASAVSRMQEHGAWVYAADMEGEPVHRANLAGSVAIILGSEGKGVARLLLDRSDGRLRIPTGGHADSLNVSVAGGVLLYEIRRQQGWLDGR
jgi:23S rRNA (guanosine2251-2'-O)-methyltransferase